MSEITKTQVAVIGGGPGGYAAAFMAADLGFEVTLIDPAENPGGVCLYRGCIPSKALLHLAKLINEARESHKWGVTFGEPEIDINKIRSWKDSVVSQLTSGLGSLSTQRKINHIRARAQFKDAHHLELKDLNNEKQVIRFDYSILATGSRPTTIPKLFIDSKRVMNSTQALNLEDIPESLLIIGGGYIGLEMGTVYAALGSKVSVVEMLPNLLTAADRDLVRILQKNLDKRFERIMLNTKVSSMKEVKNGIKIQFEGAEDQIFSKVLYSIGRTPNSEALGLENTKIKPNRQGFIPVDAHNRTVEPTIFAIGDVAGEPMLAHKASAEGRIAAEVIAGHKAAFEPAAIPAVVFTDPEIAWAGLTEQEAKDQKLAVEIMRFPWAASGRALTMDRPDGLTKLIIHKETQRILGVGIVGSGAGEMIAEGVLAIEMAANANDLKLSIHPHPTLSETLMESAEMVFGQSTHVYRPKRNR